jgi:hypothetical protein
MPEPVQSGGAQHFVGEKGIASHGEIEVAAGESGGSLAAFRDLIVEGLVLRAGAGA